MINFFIPLKYRRDRNFCWGGGKAPSPQPPPAPAPVPTEPQAGVVKSKDQLERLRFGLASTIKTRPQGLLASMTPYAGNLKDQIGK